MSDTPHNYYITTNPKQMDLPWVLAELRKTYFGATRTDEQMVECVRNSLCFAVFRRDYMEVGFPSHRDRPCAFSRVVTDGVLFSWISDFFVAEEFRGCGIGHRLMHEICEHHQLKTTTINLGTRDAQRFYARFGFVACEQMMRRPSV